jgi:hypothetical protein
MIHSHWLAWTPLAAAGLHMMEEFVYPGGFMSWSQRTRTSIRASMTPRYLILINGLLLVLCYDVGALDGTRFGVALWLGVGALLFANAVWHVVWTVRGRRYSPGVVTGVLVYVPLVAYGYTWYIKSGQTSLLGVLVPLAAGSSFQFWANLVHRYRSRR